MPSSIIGGRLPNGKYKEVSLDTSGRLECSVNEIEITADSLNVKTANLETLLNGGLPSALTGSGNLKVCLQELGNEGSERLNVDIGNDITDVLPTALTGAGNLKVSIQEHHGVSLSTSTLQGGGLPSALTGSGNLKVSIEEGSGGDASASNQATMITDLGLIKTSLQSLDDIVQAEDASHGTAHKGVMSLAVRQDTQADFGGDGDYCPMSIDANGDLRVKIDDASKTHLSEIESAVETIEACVGSNKVNVNISSGNISGFATETTLGNAETHLGVIETKSTDAEAHLGTIDTNIANAEAHLGNIDTGVDVLEACVGSNKVNVNISSGNISGFATETTLGNAEAHLGNIDTGVDVLEACVGSNKVNVNISSGNISGFATESTLGDAEAHLGVIETKSTDAEAHLGTIDTNIANAETHLGNIDTGVDVLEACVGSNKVNVNISSGNISGFATSTLQGTINTSLGTLETSLTSMEGKQDTQITHLSEIEGAVETIEACVSSNKVKTLNTQDISEGVWINNSAVNSTAFSASLETTGYTKLRLYGVVDSDFSGVPPNILITGSLTNGGTYTPLDNSTDGINTNSKYISSATVIGVNAIIENPPKFIKLYNLHGSTNFTFTLNYSLCN